MDGTWHQTWFDHSGQWPQQGAQCLKFAKIIHAFPFSDPADSSSQNCARTCFISCGLSYCCCSSRPISKCRCTCHRVDFVQLMWGPRVVRIISCGISRTRKRPVLSPLLQLRLLRWVSVLIQRDQEEDWEGCLGPASDSDSDWGDHHQPLLPQPQCPGLGKLLRNRDINWILRRPPVYLVSSHSDAIIRFGPILKQFKVNIDHLSFNFRLLNPIGRFKI